MPNDFHWSNAKYLNPSRATIPLIRPHQCDSEGGRIWGVLLYLYGTDFGRIPSCFWWQYYCGWGSISDNARLYITALAETVGMSAASRHVNVGDSIGISRQAAGLAIRNAKRITGLGGRYICFPTGQQAMQVKDEFDTVAGRHFIRSQDK